jgi:hypothetical protein
VKSLLVAIAVVTFAIAACDTTQAAGQAPQLPLDTGGSASSEVTIAVIVKRLKGGARGTPLENRTAHPASPSDRDAAQTRTPPDP